MIAVTLVLVFKKNLFPIKNSLEKFEIPAVEAKTSQRKIKETINFKKVELVIVFPQQKGFRWRYDGTFDYGSEEVIEDILHKGEKTIIIVKGKINDLSDGEAGDTSFKKQFIIKNDYPVSSANVKVDEETQAFSNLGNN